LKESPREFKELLRDWWVTNGWTQLMSEPCIYIYRHNGIFVMIGIYVDNLPLACNNFPWAVGFKRLMGKRFKIKDLDDLSKFLGMHITRDRAAKTISIDSSQYTTAMLDKRGTVDCSPSTLPMEHGFLSGIASTTMTPSLVPCATCTLA
jgi:hypothetical protein